MSAMTTRNLQEVIERFPGLNVLVLGDVMLDSYLYGSTHRLAREAPAPIVDVHRREDAPGAAGNTAANIRALGASVALLSVIGDDADGERLIDALAARDVSTAQVIRARGRTTLAKHRVIAEPQMLLRFDLGAAEALDRGAEEMLIARLRRLFPNVDAVVVSDYAYGTLTPRVIEVLTQLQERAPRVLVVDARDSTRYREAGITATKPNFDEARGLLARAGIELDGGVRSEAIAEAAGHLLERTGAHIVAVTLDTEGAVIIERGGAVYRTYAEPSSHARAAGAGDTFVAAFAMALAARAEVPAAAELASAASAVVVTRDGTTTCSAEELHEHTGRGGKLVDDVDALRAVVRAHRLRGRRIVFTNGCFDLVHRGHVSYLGEAKALGDVLIVGVNGDDSVRRLKGPDRPLNCLEDRAQVLGALSCVDLVVPFDSDTPEDLIRAICPDVVAKGGDYTREQLPEASLIEALGGEVRILPYVRDHSTTEMIDRMRASDERTYPA